MRFPVSQGQFYLLDGNSYRTVHPEPRAAGESSAGILRTVRGGAYLVTGLSLGVIDLAFGVTAHGPKPHLDDFEDVVEASIRLDTADAEVSALNSYERLSFDLPAGAGSTE